jgi:hypothetical protein
VTGIPEIRSIQEASSARKGLVFIVDEGAWGLVRDAGMRPRSKAAWRRVKIGQGSIYSTVLRPFMNNTAFTGQAVGSHDYALLSRSFGTHWPS